MVRIDFGNDITETTCDGRRIGIGDGDISWEAPKRKRRGLFEGPFDRDWEEDHPVVSGFVIPIVLAVHGLAFILFVAWLGSS